MVDLGPIDTSALGPVDPRINWPHESDQLAPGTLKCQSYAEEARTEDSAWETPKRCDVEGCRCCYNRWKKCWASGKELKN